MSATQVRRGHAAAVKVSRPNTPHNKAFEVKGMLVFFSRRGEPWKTRRLYTCLGEDILVGSPEGKVPATLHSFSDISTVDVR